MSDRIRINGTTYSWGSVKLRISGLRYTGLSSISYSDKLETTFAYGMGAGHRPRAQSRGKYVPEQITMKVQSDTAQAIRNMMAARGNGKSYGMPRVPIVLQYIEPGEGPITVKFEHCRLVEDGSSDEEGSDVLAVEMKWTTFAIIRNGKTLYEDR